MSLENINDIFLRITTLAKCLCQFSMNRNKLRKKRTPKLVMPIIIANDDVLKCAAGVTHFHLAGFQMPKLRA